MNTTRTTSRNTMEKLVQVFFLEKPCLEVHVQALFEQPDDYKAMLDFMIETRTLGTCSPATKARILAALHIRHEHKAVLKLLGQCEIPDIVKALSILDRPRKLRQLKAKIAKIESEHPHLVQAEAEKEEGEATTSAGSRKKRQTKDEEADSGTKKPRKRRAIDKLRRVCQQLASAEVSCVGDPLCEAAQTSKAVQEMVDSGASVSGALARKIQIWTKTLPSDFLEFVLLGMPLQPWKELADLIHLRPSDFTVPYFLEYAHGNEKSAGRTFVSVMKELLQVVEDGDESAMEKTYFKIATEFPQKLALQYPLLRRYKPLLQNVAIMESISARVPLDTAIWNYEEFNVGQCDDIIKERLVGSDKVVKSFANSKVTFGKLIERILTCRRLGASFAEDLLPVANAKLTELKRLWGAKLGASGAGNNKIAVFGDASSSMQTAIEAATIFASMVSACFDGELSFFDSHLVPSPHLMPSNAQEALEICKTVKAQNCTCNAACLLPYYEQKKVFDMFVMVTDEGENEAVNCGGDWLRFAALLSRYKKEINPNVKLVIARVGEGDRYFRKSLEEHGIDCTVVRLDERRPDHAKFDALLGQLAILASNGSIAFPSVDAMEVEVGDDFVVV